MISNKFYILLLEIYCRNHKILLYYYIIRIIYISYYIRIAFSFLLMCRLSYIMPYNDLIAYFGELEIFAYNTKPIVNLDIGSFN